MLMFEERRREAALKFVEALLFSTTTLVIGSSAQAKEAFLPAAKATGCQFAFGEESVRKKAGLRLTEQIVARASQRLENLIAGASFKLKIHEDEFEIRAHGLPAADAYIKAQIGYLKSIKVSDVDFLPSSYEEAGLAPLITLTIKEVRVQSHDANGDTLRRKGIGTLLTDAVISIAKLYNLQRISGRFDQTNKALFLDAYRGGKTIRESIDATFTGKLFKVRGIAVDMENSLLIQHTDTSKEPYSFWVTFKL